MPSTKLNLQKVNGFDHRTACRPSHTRSSMLVLSSYVRTYVLYSTLDQNVPDRSRAPHIRVTCILLTRKLIRASFCCASESFCNFGIILGKLRTPHSRCAHQNSALARGCCRDQPSPLRIWVLQKQQGLLMTACGPASSAIGIKLKVPRQPRRIYSFVGSIHLILKIA